MGEAILWVDDPRVQEALRGAYLVRVDLDFGNTEDEAVGWFPWTAFPVFFALGADARPTGVTIASNAWGSGRAREHRAGDPAVRRAGARGRVSARGRRGKKTIDDGDAPPGLRCCTVAMYDSTSLIHLRTSSLASLVISGFGALLVGCTIVVGDVGHDARDDQDAWEQCYEQYDDCLDGADGDKDAVLACGDQLDACTSEHDGDATATAGATAGADGGADTAADGGADTGTGGAPSSEICVSLHQTCIAGAVDIAGTLACEALFDHCAHPGECPDCADGCPEAQLEQCLDDYAGCVAGATKDYEIEACNVVFDGCVAELGADACLPADDAHTDECLAEHALCTACAETDAELEACKDIFDVCVAPAPM